MDIEGEDWAFSADERAIFWSVAVIFNVLWLCLYCSLLASFLFDHVYRQPTLRAFLPHVVGNFLVVLFTTLSWGSNLARNSEMREVPEALQDAGPLCNTALAGFASGYVSLAGLAFTAWVPLELVRCARKFVVLRLPPRVLWAVVLAGLILGACCTAANVHLNGRAQYRGLTCSPKVWGDPGNMAWIIMPFFVLLLWTAISFRCVHFITGELEKSTPIARLKQRTAEMMRFSWIGIANTAFFNMPLVLVSFLEVVGIEVSKVLVAAAILCSLGQSLGTSLMLWSKARLLRCRCNARNETIITTFAQAKGLQTSLDLALLKNRGVSLQYLHWFTQQNCVNQGMTVGEVMTKFVISATAEDQSNYCEHIKDLVDSDGHPAVGEPSFFVSHCWNDTFLNLLDHLVSTYRHQASGGPLYFWIDIFAINQHVCSMECDLASMHTVIQSCSQGVLLTLNPWSAPQTLTRVWCLWEILKAVQYCRQVLPVLTAEGESHFIQTLQSEREKVVELLDTIEVKNAKATVPRDKSQIFGEIEKTVGFDFMNTHLKTKLEMFLQSLAIDKSICLGHYANRG